MWLWSHFQGINRNLLGPPRGFVMRIQFLFPVIVLLLAALCPIDASAQDAAAAAEGSGTPSFEKRVLFAPLTVPSVAPRDNEPTLFVPALFRPPVPWLKLDDRYESFVGDVAIQAELQEMEQLFLNPYADLGRELTAGIETEVGAYGEVVRYYEFAGGKFEFSTSGGGYSRPGAWAGTYDYDSWLDRSNRGAGDQ